MKKPVRYLAISLGVVLAACMCTSEGIASFQKGPSATLDSGHVADFRWKATVFGNGNRPFRPCVRVDLQPARHPLPLDPTEVQVGETQCAPVPNLLSVVNELNRPKITALVMAFSREARSVSLYFNGQIEDRTIPLDGISARKARRIGIAPFSYMAIAFSGNSCVSRFVTHAKSGVILEDGGHMQCRVHSKRS